MHSPCLGQSELFDSADLTDHIIARDSCRSCPMITDCRERSADLPFKEGTWAGELWVHGHPASTAICRGCGAPFTRARSGRQAYCAPDCQAAHNDRQAAIRAARAARTAQKEADEQAAWEAAAAARDERRNSISAGLPACKRCGASASETCRSKSGVPTGKPHKDRGSARCCPCGADVVGQAQYCAPCGLDFKRASKREYNRRVRAEARALNARRDAA